MYSLIDAFADLKCNEATEDFILEIVSQALDAIDDTNCTAYKALEEFEQYLIGGDEQ